VPLAFDSTSHGTIAFGFFNIETDLLLLDRLFVFADRFCRGLTALAGAEGEEGVAVPGWRIDDRRAMGNLHGAIAGTDLSGLIGATYRRWPFPAAPEGFAQQPEGIRNQEVVAGMIEPFSVPLRIDLARDRARGLVSIGDYRFTDLQLAALVAYVDRGGYPRWRGDVRPPYVLEMLAALRRLGSPWA
jgi:hypothetical protein